MVKSSVRLSLLAVLVLIGAAGDAAVGVTAPAATAAPSVPATVEFNRDVRAILSDNCFYCHGPDKNKREADLRLDTRDGLFKALKHGTVIVPGHPEQSDLFRRITTHDDKDLMPPRKTDKTLTPADIAVLKKWIEQGAPWEGHWIYTPLKHAAPPPVAKTDWARNPIDDFILARLSETGLEPSPEADRVTLIRRLSFDLTGLPPTPQQVDDFVSDTRPRAYERVVDRLLNSPEYGERMAVWWLDLVRYADSVGYHGDQAINMFPFREYVIRAFNENMPFDQFTTEQLAGDLLPNPTKSQRIAAAYNRLNMMSAEGGGQDKEYRAKYASDRVRATSVTWLGATLGCAECHDHKFDPYTTKDFYRFAAFFADVQERGIYSGSEGSGKWGETMAVGTAEQERTIADADAEIVKLKAALAADTPELAAAQAEWEKTFADIKWVTLAPENVTGSAGTAFKTLPDGSLLALGNAPATETYTLKLHAPFANVTGFRIEVLPDDSLAAKGPGRANNGNFVLTEVKVKFAPDAKPDVKPAETPVKLQSATATFEQTSGGEGTPYGKFGSEAVIDDDAKGANWGWAILPETGKENAIHFETAPDSPSGSGTYIIEMLHNYGGAHSIGRFRISATNSARPLTSHAPPKQVAAILATAPAARTEAQKNELAVFYRAIAPQLEPIRKQLTETTAKRDALSKSLPHMPITVSGPPRVVRILKRGNWMDDTGEIVLPGVPHFLTQPTVEGDRRLTRLDLAQWITSRENPITARVFVNRVWKICFGAGLSRRLDDLGSQGEWPSHPLLLDWLAGRFVESGWDVKQLVRLMVTSSAYRQSSRVSNDLRERDPYNRLIARQARYRVEAEFVRDASLEISGLLVREIGGASVKPYQPPGFWAYLNFPTREWQNSNGESLYRRGLYTHWQRQYLHPALTAFDAPSREECTAERVRSNTPLQALVLLNDPEFVEAARAFAERIIRDGGKSDDERLAWAFREAVSRPIKPAEAATLAALLTSHRDQYRQDPAAVGELLKIGTHPAPKDIDAAELAAFTSVARTILNLHETITRN